MPHRHLDAAHELYDLAEEQRHASSSEAAHLLRQAQVHATLAIAEAVKPVVSIYGAAAAHQPGVEPLGLEEAAADAATRNVLDAYVRLVGIGNRRVTEGFLAVNDARAAAGLPPLTNKDVR